MAQFKVDQRDIKFVLLEQLDINKLLGLPSFKDFGVEDVTVFIDEALKMASEVIAPLNAPADKQGCKFENGAVTTPKGFKEAYAAYAETGYGSMSISPENGGMGLPETVAAAIGEVFTGACVCFTMTPGLSRAACNVLAAFGSAELKEKFLTRMVTGEWAGTMCLTEPQAGSDLACVKTVATPDGGAYRIKGNKIFITSGDHDLTPNIVHLVLARTPGAPAGVKGISLFLVPKFRVNDDGGLGERNDVACGGIEEKMGIHGSPTCTLNFGDNDGCVGHLIGELNDGIKYMFKMMNEERLMVGMQGQSIAAVAYQKALQFASERVQGPSVKTFKDPEAARVPIIQHPDVRRMLLTMKAYTEGLRSLLYHTGFYIDVAHHSEDPKEKEKFGGWVELLTPICKAYSTDMAFRVADLAVQTHGGYGYCAEYEVEQHLRDIKITSIYEGTNGIQSMDLLARKIGMKGGSVLMGYVMHLNGFVEKNKGHERLAEAVARFDEAKNKVGEAAMQFSQAMMKQDLTGPLLNACGFLEMFGDVAVSYYLLDAAAVAWEKLKAIFEAKGASDEAAQAKIVAENDEAKFYFGKVETADFFVASILPRVFWTGRAIKNNNSSAMRDIFPVEGSAAV